MTTSKHFFILLLIALIAVPAVNGQSNSSGGNREMTVEESYLQEAVEMMSIRETIRTEGLDQKMLALRYIGEAIERGNTGNEICQALEYLSREGLSMQARENGRLVNNYTLARREAARYLGQLGTVEARDVLITVCNFEREPMVLQEAIKSLGDIGNNDDEKTTDAIIWIVRRFDVLNPDNLMALSAVDAIAKIAEKNGGLKNPANAIQLLMTIANGPYTKPVQAKARAVLDEMRKYGTQNRNTQR
jgi:hypothetical protein